MYVWIDTRRRKNSWRSDHSDVDPFHTFFLGLQNGVWSSVSMNHTISWSLFGGRDVLPRSAKIWRFGLIKNFLRILHLNRGAKLFLLRTINIRREPKFGPIESAGFFPCKMDLGQGVQILTKVFLVCLHITVTFKYIFILKISKKWFLTGSIPNIKLKGDTITEKQIFRTSMASDKAIGPIRYPN